MPSSSGGSESAHQNAAWADSEKIESSQLLDKVRLVIRQMWCRDGFTGGAWSLIAPPAIPHTARSRLEGDFSVGRSGRGRPDLDHAGELDQLSSVPVGVILA